MPKNKLVINTQINLLQKLIKLLKLYIDTKWSRDTKQSLIFRHAENALGTDVSPKDLAPDELGCAESVCAVIARVMPFAPITGTWTLWQTLRNDPRFEETDKMGGAGTIIISPTGTGNRGATGHVGILGKTTSIMSNSSATGLWTYNYQQIDWYHSFHTQKGFPIYFYKAK